MTKKTKKKNQNKKTQNKQNKNKNEPAVIHNQKAEMKYERTQNCMM